VSRLRAIDRLGCVLDLNEVLARLEKSGSEKDRQGMARFGINAEKAFGVRIPVMRALAKEIGKDRALADRLWRSGYHEARILAGMVDDPKSVTERQMEEWVVEFNSWDLCDQVILNLFEKTPFAYKKAVEWHKRDEEFVKRAGYVLMARLAVCDKKADDAVFIRFFPFIKKGVTDERNFVKKAVNWAIRQIGKRNRALNKRTVAFCRELREIDSPSARWIVADAMRELTDEKTIGRLKK